MSEKPAITRRGDGKLMLNESAEALVWTFAQKHCVDRETVLADVERGLPAARLLLAMMGISVPAVKVGRPADDDRFKHRYFVISTTVTKLGEPEGIKAAAAKLKISESMARTIRNGRITKNGKHEGGMARAYWEPPASDEDC